MLAQAGYVLAGAGLVALLAAGAHRLLGTPIITKYTVYPFIALTALAIAVAWWRNRPRLMGVALMIDERLDLKERFSAALALAENEHPFAQAACHDARQAADGLDVIREFPLQATRRWWLTAGSWLAFACVLAFVPSMDMLGMISRRQDRQQDQQSLQQAKLQLNEVTSRVESVIQQLNSGAQLDDDLAALKKIAELRGPTAIRRESVRKLGELSDALRKIRDQQLASSVEAMKDILKDLRNPTDGLMPKFSHALARGDFNEAEKILRDLQKALAESKMTDEEKQALCRQLSDLAGQLAGLADQENRTGEMLKEAGLNEDLASLDEQQLRQAMKDAGMTDQQIDDLLKKLADMRQASKQCNKLGESMAGACENPGSMSAQDLAELLQQLENMAAAEGQLAAAQAAIDEIENAIRKMGGGQGLALAAGPKSQSAGAGVGGDGQGLSPKAGDQPGGSGDGAQVFGQRGTDQTGQTATTGTQAANADAATAGPPIAVWYFRGDQVRGESHSERQEVVRSAKDAAAEAINDNRVPQRYRSAVRDYFEDLSEGN